MNSLEPIPAYIDSVDPLNEDTSLFTFSSESSFDLEPGQFIEITLPGVGNFPVSTCHPVFNQDIQACIRRVGRVTEALFRLAEGAPLGLRGPFGKGFDLQRFANRDVLMIAGGLGMAPLRGLLLSLLDQRHRFGRVILLYGSREPNSLLFREELVGFANKQQIELRFSVDFAADMQSSFNGVVCQVGLVNELLQNFKLNPTRTVAAVCGPPALYSCILDQLSALGIDEEFIFATLERRMRCGIGECCHCVVGDTYICQEGPVFSLTDLRAMPGAF
jgi:NAD(P)H-flavin reductase